MQQYLLGETTLSEAQLRNKAIENNISLEDLLEMNPDIKLKEDLSNNVFMLGDKELSYDQLDKTAKNNNISLQQLLDINPDIKKLPPKKTLGDLGKQFLFGSEEDNNTSQLIPILGDVSNIRNTAEGVVDFFKQVARPSKEKVYTEIEETDRKKPSYLKAQIALNLVLGNDKLILDNPIINYLSEGISNQYRSGGVGIESGEETQPSINVRDANVVTLEKAEAMIGMGKDKKFKEPTDNIRRYQSRYDQVNEEHGGTVAFFVAAVENPWYLRDIGIQSMAMMGSALANSKDVQKNALLAAPAVGLATSRLPTSKNPLGFSIGFLSTLFGSVSGTMDAGLSYAEFVQEGMKEEGLDYTPENMVKYLQNPEVITHKDPNGLPFMDITGTRAEIQRTRSIRRGWAIGTIDAATGMFSGGTARGVFAPKKKLTTRIKKAIKGTGVAIGGGLVSEIGGQTLGSQEYHAGEILTEGFAEKGIAMTGITVVPQLLKKKGKYSIRGEEMSEARFVKEVNQMDRTTLAMADVKVENDNVMENQVNSIIYDAYLDSQVDASIKDPKHREELIRLQKELNKANNDLKKGNKDKSSAVPGIKDKILGLEKEIADIIAGYESAVDIGQTETAKKVKKERVKVFLKATEKFAEISSEQLDFDPYEAFDSNEDYVSAFVERMMASELSDMTDKQLKAYVDSGQIEKRANELANEANNSDGVNVITAADGSTKIMINREKAAEYGAMNVGSHEVLHGVMEGALNQLENLDIEDAKKRKAEGKKAIATKDTRVGKLISQFRGQIKTNLGQDVVDKIEERLRAKDGYNMSEEQIATTSEWFNLLSDIIQDERNNITYEGNKGFWNSIKDNIAGIFNEHTPYEKLSIETGEQAFNFMKEYSKSVKAGKLSESMVAFAKGKPQPTKDKAAFSKTTPRAQQFLDAEIDNKSLVDIINSPQSTQEDRFAAAEAIIEKNWPVISNALKFNPTGNIPIQAVKEAINEQILGIFPQVTLQDGTKISRKTPLFNTYNKETEVTTFLSATLKPRQPEIYARAKAIGGIEQMGVDISEAKDIKAPKPTKPKPSKKARKLKSLSDVNLDNKDVVSQTIYNKVVNILEQNPKNLTKQLNALIEKEFMKAIKEGMGKVTKTVEGFASKEYKAYHALNYENHIKALDVKTIKKNYNTLFDIKKVGREKDKRVNPVTGEVTYPGIGIYDIKTNKAKFTKHFIDGGYTTLLDRQKKLAQLIAASLTKDAVNKFKIENSNDINTIVEAEIDSFLDTLEKQKGENKTFDTVKFSRSKVEKGMGLLIHEGIGDSINSDTAKKIIYKYKLDPSVVKKAKQVIDKSKAQFSNSIKTEFPKETTDAGVIKQIRNAIKRVWSASVPKEKTFKETYDPKTGETVGKNVEIRMLERLWNEKLGITWGERMVKPLNNFLDKNPQYYRLLRELLTGGDRAVFMNVDRFEQFIPETEKIKNTDQVFNKRVKIHRDLTEKEKELGFKGKRLLNPKNWNFEKTNEKDKFKNFIQFFKDLSVWLNTDQNKVHTWIMEELVIHSAVDQSNFFRKAATPYAYQIYENNKPITDQAVVEEHTPINEIVKIIMDAAIRGNVKEVEVVLRALLGQASILEINDPSGKLKASLGVDFYEKVLPKIVKGVLKLKDGHAGIYRLMKHGVDPFGIRLLNEKTIAEEFSVDHLSPDEAKQDIINQFEEGKVRYSKTNATKSPLSKDIHKRKTISKASNFSRSSKNPTKGLSAWDFDDTVARTKSGVMYTMPNPEGTPQPGRKVIFMAGGPGSGKSTVIKGLDLKNQGFKIVNQDISLEWLMKNHGLPTDMKDFTPEQHSKFSSLGWEARKIAKRKQSKFQGKGDGIIVDGTGASLNAMKKQVQEFKDKGYDVQMVFVETSLETALERNRVRKERSLRDGIVKRTHESVQNNKEGFRKLFGDNFAEVKTDNFKIGDAMPQSIVGKMDKFTKGYIKGRLSAEEFANEGSNILEQGGKFDFAEFDVVTKGEKGPLFGEAMNRAKKYGLKDNYILTARPHAAKVPIYEFLKSQGLNIPLDNIITLESSTPESKSLWIADKVGEGYNDIYFADDALQNIQAVQNMLDQFDVKGRVQLAKTDFIHGDPQVVKSIEEASKNDVKDVGGLANPGTYNNIKFSKSHRTEYEKTIAKHRPDLVKDRLVSQTIDNMFIFIDNLNIPNDKKRKYERITTKWIATSNIKLLEDRFKITDAINLAERFKLDLFSYNNPNEIIEAYAGKVKKKPLNPNKVKEFSPGRVYSKKHDITVHEVEDTKKGMQSVRNIVSSHWGENSNPWCISQARNGKLTEDAWLNWMAYRKTKKQIIFQDGKLLGFYANGMFWDRMDNATEAPVIQIKEGRVTRKVELVSGEEVLKETRTVSKDGNTVTTEFISESEFKDGTKIIENRVNGKTVKSTRYNPDGKVVEIKEFNKDGKATASYNFFPDGKMSAVNTHGQPFGDMTTNEVVRQKGDILSHQYNEGGIAYMYGRIKLNDQITEVGWKVVEKNSDLKNVIKTVDGKVRLDLKKVLEIDADAKGLPKTNIKFSKSMNTEFNDILEEVTGIDSKKRFSAIKARKRGESKGKFRFFIPPSHEDFVGLLYNFMGKGKKGNQHRDFFEQVLVRPLNRAYRELNTAKQAIANDYKSLNKEFKNVKKKLTKKTPDGDFTYQDAIRVYLWDKHGHKVPGLTKTDQQNLVDLVMADAELQTYAETLNIISKQEAYVSPTESWEGGDIRTDLDDATGRVGRASYFTEFDENADIIFSQENLNKIEAAYGEGMVSAIKDILYRTKTGRNRPSGQNKLVNGFINYLNGSVASTMFFNMRSAVLQQMSMVNFINFADNNVFAAAKAFANQKQYWTDWAFIFNSDFMKQRRGGIKTDVNGAELAASLRGAKNTPRALLAKLLQLGFLPTQIGDNMAIATGGSTFYRNRINTYLKQGLSQKEAQEKAWIDFQVLAEATQQSARPDMVSQQQASPLGKFILAFQNITSQMNRIGKKSFSDIYNRRITPGNTTQFQSDISNMSRIGYYFAIQNLIFYSLQSALFLALFEDDEDDEKWLKKKERVINGSIDSVLRGTGVWGAVVATLKNMAIKWHEQRDKKYNPDESSVLMEMLNVSPPLGIKARKMVNAEKTLNYNKKVIDEMETFDIDNPMWSAVTNYIEATTNAPTNRIYNKTQNVRQSLNNQHEAYQRALMFGGWSQWNLGIENEKIEKIKDKKKFGRGVRRTRTRTRTRTR